MKPAWKLHGKSMKPASVRIQDRTTRFQETVFSPVSKINRQLQKNELEFNHQVNNYLELLEIK
jgi:hypothetical protein